MNLEKYLKQEITYWAPLESGDDGFGGRLLNPPVTFFGRWIDKLQTVLSNRGEQIVSKATIYFPENICPEADGWLVKGRFTEDAGPPNQITGAQLIRQTNDIPDLRSLSSLKYALV